MCGQAAKYSIERFLAWRSGQETIRFQILRPAIAAKPNVLCSYCEAAEPYA